MATPHPRAEIHYQRYGRVYRVEAYPNPTSDRWIVQQYWVDLLSAPLDQTPNILAPNPPIPVNDPRLPPRIYDPDGRFWDVNGVTVLLDIYDQNELNPDAPTLEPDEFRAVRRYQERFLQLSLREAYFHMTFFSEEGKG